MLSPKAYLKLVIGALVLPSCLGLESAAASVQNKLSSQEIAPVVQKQANLNPGSSLQIAEYEEFDADQLKGGHHCYRPRRVSHYRVHNPCSRYERSRYRHDDDDHEEYGHRRGRRYRHDDDHDSDRYDHEDYHHESIHFGRHQKRHGRHCI
ncbi:MAG: hypothetical protein KME64_05920 [Scytonematopsis contorta HA4267-MV1]|nr:hypothetical protein [Scytonematopsis contorta HA4267-MV1]